MWGRDRAKFGNPETTLRGKSICATGKIQQFRVRKVRDRFPHPDRPIDLTLRSLGDYASVPEDKSGKSCLNTHLVLDSPR